MCIRDSFYFECFGKRDELLNVAIVRGSFDLLSDGKIRIAPSQSPVVVADCYRGQPTTSSVEVETDLLPLKQNADITFDSVAYPPSGMPSKRWEVSVVVGKIDKKLAVTGPRFWYRTPILGWQLTEPAPTDKVPLQYELAFGGRSNSGDGLAYEENPVGLGYVSNLDICNDRVRAPQIEELHDPIRGLGKRHVPAGLGPIAKHWMPRRALCGTADENWKQQRWPMRPTDFDFDYYNSASNELTYPGLLNGDECVSLYGLSQRGKIEFSLPNISVTMFAISVENEIELAEMTLDTLHVDTENSKVFLTWRFSWSKTSPLDTIQLTID